MIRNFKIALICLFRKGYRTHPKPSVRKELRQEADWKEATETAERKNKHLMGAYFFDFLLHNLRMGRFGFLARRFVRKTPQHLISRKKLARDFKALKAFLGF